MRSGELFEALARAEGPVIVCAQAGNVNTGAFDPIAQIAEATNRHGVWLHVDGAFGLWAAASPALRRHVEGIEGAQSWATDAHKWLNVPYDSGLVFVADRQAHNAAMTVTAAYLVRGAGDAYNSYDYVPNRRAARAALPCTRRCGPSAEQGSPTRSSAAAHTRGRWRSASAQRRVSRS